jgi:hypothetical protein
MSKLGWAVIPFSAAVEDAQSDRGRIALARFHSSANLLRQQQRQRICGKGEEQKPQRGCASAEASAW